MATVVALRQRRAAVNTEYVLLMVLCALALILGVMMLSGVISDKHISLADALWGKDIPSLTAGWTDGDGGSGSGSGSAGASGSGVDGAPIYYTINYGGSVTVWTDEGGTPTYRLIGDGANILVDNSDVPTMTMTPSIGGFSVRIDDSIPSSTESTVVNGFWSADIQGTDLTDGRIRIYSNNPYGFTDFTIYRDGVLLAGTAATPSFDVVDSGGHTYTIHDGKDISSLVYTTAVPVYRATYRADNTSGIRVHGTDGNYLNSAGSGVMKAVAADAAGNIWALRNGTNIVFQFSPTGTQLRTFTVAGAAPGTTYCFDIQVDNTRNVVYLADAATTAGQAGIVRYTTTGTYIGEWATANRPYAISLDSDGNVYCAEPTANRIRVIDPAGTQLRTWGSVGAGNGQFASGAADGVAVDRRNDTVYVLDRGNRRIQAFTKMGVYLRQWSIASNFAVNDPTSINVDLDGNVYVTTNQPSANYIVAYDENGTYLGLSSARATRDIAFAKHARPQDMK